jgi:hypothetical protein
VSPALTAVLSRKWERGIAPVQNALRLLSFPRRGPNSRRSIPFPREQPTASPGHAPVRRQEPAPPRIRAAEAADLDALERLEHLVFPSDRLSRRSFRRFL